MNQHNELPKPSRWTKRLRLAKYLSWTAFVTVGAYSFVFCCEELRSFAGAKYAHAMELAKEKLVEVKVIEKVHVLDPERVPVEDLINQISADAGLNPLIIRALAEQESGKYLPIDRIRYEPQLMPKVNAPRHLNEIERQLYASSIGLTQVIYGLHKERCGLKSYADLLDPANSIRCSIIILKANLEACRHIKQPGLRLREALRMYNGRGEMAEAYADRVMQRLADMLLLNLGEGV